jgi:hypothetical protein
MRDNISSVSELMVALAMMTTHATDFLNPKQLGHSFPVRRGSAALICHFLPIHLQGHYRDILFQIGESQMSLSRQIVEFEIPKVHPCLKSKCNMCLLNDMYS